MNQLIINVIACVLKYHDDHGLRQHEYHIVYTAYLKLHDRYK